MSRQLTISSLFSAFALVTLALLAQAGVYEDGPAGHGARVMQVEQFGVSAH